MQARVACRPGMGLNMVQMADQFQCPNVLRPSSPAKMLHSSPTLLGHMFNPQSMCTAVNRAKHISRVLISPTALYLSNCSLAHFALHP